MNWMYISEIVKRFKRQGLEEFARNKYTSHNRKLSYQQERKKIFFKNAREKQKKAISQQLKKSARH